MAAGDAFESVASISLLSSWFWPLRRVSGCRLQHTASGNGVHGALSVDIVLNAHFRSLVVLATRFRQSRLVTVRIYQYRRPVPRAVPMTATYLGPVQDKQQRWRPRRAGRTVDGCIVRAGSCLPSALFVAGKSTMTVHVGAAWSGR